jgi:hypothetical protein
MEQCLSKGASARKFAISLGTLEYSGDLADKMMQFSSKMEKLYHHLQDLVSRKVQDETSYRKYFTILDEKTQWYEKAEVGPLNVWLSKFVLLLSNNRFYIIYLFSKISECT